MCVLKSAWSAPSLSAEPLRGDPAVGANLRMPVAPVAEVLAVFFAVAGDAECRAVGGIKSQLGELRERLEVMCVKVNAMGAALLAGVVVPLEYVLAPLAQLVTHSGTFALQRLAVLPCAGKGTNLVRMGALSRAVDALPVSTRLERIATVEAKAFGSSICPTRLTTVLRRLRAIRVHLVRLVTDGACERSSGLSGWDWTSLDRWHGQIITPFDPAYCDVIVTRWQNVTGQTATRDEAVS